MKVPMPGTERRAIDLTADVGAVLEGGLEFATNKAAGPVTWVCPEKVFKPLRRTTPELLFTSPPLPLIAAESCVLFARGRASVNVLPVLAMLLPEIVNWLDQLFVQVCDASRSPANAVAHRPRPG